MCLWSARANTNCDSASVLLSPESYALYQRMLTAEGDLEFEDDEGHIVVLDANCSVTSRDDVPDSQVWIRA